MPQRDWLDWVVGISQVIGAISTAAAGIFAALALKANKRDREERDRPFLAARRGEYIEAPIPDDVNHPSFNVLQTNPENTVEAIVVNVGNGPLVDLSVQLGFRLENDLDEVLAQKPLSGFLGEGVIAVGDHLSTIDIVSQINGFLSIDRPGVAHPNLGGGHPLILRLHLTIEAIYRDRGSTYYTQTFYLSSRLELYELLSTQTRTYASDETRSKELENVNIQSRWLRTRSIAIYHVRQTEQVAISVLPKRDRRRFYVENRDKAPEELEKAKRKLKRRWILNR